MEESVRFVATVSGVNTNFQTLVANLEVMNIEEIMHLQMPNLFSAKKMKISISALAHQVEVRRWEHLNGIMLPETLCNGGFNLPICVNVPKALQ